MGAFDRPRACDMHHTLQQEVVRYLHTGKYDEPFHNWPGDNVLVRCQHANAALRDSLLSTVRQRTASAAAPASMEVAAFTRKKVEPMVRGLFPESEQSLVLNLLAGSVVFVTSESIEKVLQTTLRLGTAWDLANLYLLSCDAEPLSKDAPFIVGLSTDSTCFVALD